MKWNSRSNLVLRAPPPNVRVGLFRASPAQIHDNSAAGGLQLHADFRVAELFDTETYNLTSNADDKVLPGAATRASIHWSPLCSFAT